MDEIYVYLITPQSRKSELDGQEWTAGIDFAPVQDADGNWCVSVEEVEGLTNTTFSWLQSCPKILWNPPILPPPFLMA